MKIIFKSCIMMIGLMMIVASAGCNLLQKEEPEVQYLQVAPESIAATFVIQDFEIGMLQLRIVKSDGTFTQIVVTMAMLSAADYDKLSTPGTHQITIQHLNMSATCVVTMRHDDITATLISIHRLAVLLGYLELDFDSWLATFVTPGLTVLEVMVNVDGELVVFMSDDSHVNAGPVRPGQAVHVLSAHLNELGELVLVYSDDSEHNLGTIAGLDGLPGLDGIGIGDVTINEAGALIITLTDGTVLDLGIIRETEIPVKVVFRYDDHGQAYDIVHLMPDTWLTEPTPPQRQGYAFTGWHVEGELIEFPYLVTETEALDIVARWERIIFTYEVHNNQVTITGFLNPTYHATIPAMIDGYPVTKIGAYAFFERFIFYAVIPDSVVEIGIGAFMNCSILGSVTFGDDSRLQKIETEAFKQTALNRITLPDRLLTIGPRAFQNSQLRQVVFGSHSRLNVIYDQAFADNPNLANFVIPKGVIVIGNGAFANNSILTLYSYQSAKLDNWLSNWNIDGRPVVWRIHDHGVHESLYYMISDSLDARILGIVGTPSTLIVPENIEGYPVRRIGPHAFKLRDHVSQVLLPDNLMVIEEQAFNQMMGLRYVYISDQSLLTTIGQQAFKSNSNLHNIYLPAMVMSIGDETFAGCSRLEIFTRQTSAGAGWHANFNPLGRPVRYGMTGAGRTDAVYYVADQDNHVIITGVLPDVRSVVLPLSIAGKAVTTIAENAFSIFHMNSITIPSSVLTIGANAFQYASNLNIYTTHASPMPGWHVNWNSSNRPVSWDMLAMGVHDQIHYVVPANKEVIIIGRQGTAGHVTIPDHIDVNPVVTIAANAFRNDSNLQSIAIGAQVKTIGTNAFNASGLESVTIPASVQTIEAGAFTFNQQLVSVIFEEGSVLTMIGESAFAHCYALTSIILPEGLLSIGRDAFMSCASLTSVHIPASTLTIGQTAFAYASGLQTVVFAKGSMLHTLGDEAFIFTTALKTIELPSGITVIASGLFANSGLTSITIGDHVTAIGNNAFDGCRDLVEVRLSEHAMLESIGSYAFYDNPSLSGFVIPSRVSFIDNAAFGGMTDMTIAVRMSTQPPGWHIYWNVHHLPVIWGYED